MCKYIFVKNKACIRKDVISNRGIREPGSDGMSLRAVGTQVHAIAKWGGFHWSGNTLFIAK